MSDKTKISFAHHTGSPCIATVGRNFTVEAITNIIDQCKAAGIPPYCKQDCALKPGQQGRIPTEYWRIKEFPKV